MKVRTGLAAVAVAAGLSAFGSAQADDCAGKAGPNRLTVQVASVRAAMGEVAVTVYPDDPPRFLAPKGKLLRQRVPAQAPATKACFYLPVGYYAVAVYHDANADRDFNRNAIGLPIEGFGFSNDAPTKVGIPAFSTVRFRTRPGESVIVLHMRYPR